MKNNEEKAMEIIGNGCQRENCLECGGKLSVENGCVQFRRLMEMAAWKEQQMIEKAAEWVKKNLIHRHESPLEIFNLLDDFKQAMKKE